MTDTPNVISWRLYWSAPEARRDQATKRLAMVRLAQRQSVPYAADYYGVAYPTLRRWCAVVNNAPTGAALPSLLPQNGNAGRPATTAVNEKIWDYLKADYLRLEAPSLSACIRRANKYAARRELSPLPSEATVRRRLTAEISPSALALARGGGEAFEKTYPSQTRTTAGMMPLDAVNGDGFRVNVFVETARKTIKNKNIVCRPVLWVWQDIRTRKILAWRIAETENEEMMRLSFADVCRHHGIPQKIYLDNTLTAANKRMTAGAHISSAARRRHTETDDEPLGVFAQLGCEVHNTRLVEHARTISGKRKRGGAGQSKPVERFFGTLDDELCRHPSMAGYYTGRNAMVKPANYDSGRSGVPWEQFVAHCNTIINEINARCNRHIEGLQRGESVDDFYAREISNVAVRLATEEQLRLLLRPAEVVKVSVDGTITLRAGQLAGARNRYYDDALLRMAGKRVSVRYDPQRLHESVAVFDVAGVFVADAVCMVPAAFQSASAATAHNRARQQARRAAEEELNAHKRAAQIVKAEAYANQDGAINANRKNIKIIRIVSTGKHKDNREAIRRGKDLLARAAAGDKK